MTYHSANRTLKNFGTDAGHYDSGDVKRRPRRSKLGASIPTTPTKNRPNSGTLACEWMTAKILQRIEEFALTPTEIQERYPAFRRGYITAMREGVLFGEKRLMAICESIGIYPVLTCVGTAREQARLMGVA